MLRPSPSRPHMQQKNIPLIRHLPEHRRLPLHNLSKILHQLLPVILRFSPDHDLMRHALHRKLQPLMHSNLQWRIHQHIIIRSSQSKFIIRQMLQPRRHPPPLRRLHPHHHRIAPPLRHIKKYRRRRNKRMRIIHMPRPIPDRIRIHPPPHHHRLTRLRILNPPGGLIRLHDRKRPPILPHCPNLLHRPRRIQNHIPPRPPHRQRNHQRLPRHLRYPHRHLNHLCLRRRQINHIFNRLSPGNIPPSLPCQQVNTEQKTDPEPSSRESRYIHSPPS